jgi:F420-0:gamma-glutamyl ligase-like protein
VVLLVIALESLGFRIVGSLVDLVAMSVWTVVAALVVVGFTAGRLIQRVVRSRDMQRERRRV